MEKKNLRTQARRTCRVYNVLCSIVTGQTQRVERIRIGVPCDRRLVFHLSGRQLVAEFRFHAARKFHLQKLGVVSFSVSVVLQQFFSKIGKSFTCNIISGATGRTSGTISTAAMDRSTGPSLITDDALEKTYACRAQRVQHNYTFAVRIDQRSKNRYLRNTKSNTGTSQVEPNGLRSKRYYRIPATGTNDDCGTGNVHAGFKQERFTIARSSSRCRFTKVGVFHFFEITDNDNYYRNNYSGIALEDGSEKKKTIIIPILPKYFNNNIQKNIIVQELPLHRLMIFFFFHF